MFEDYLFGTKYCPSADSGTAITHIVGVGGRPVRVIDVHWRCLNSAAAISLHNGTTNADTALFLATGAAIYGTTADVDMLFPLGCAIHCYTNVLAATVNYREEL